MSAEATPTPGEPHEPHEPHEPREKEIVARTMMPLNDTVVLSMLPDADLQSKIILPQGARVNYARAKRAYVVDAGPHARGCLPAQEVLVAPFADGVDVTVPGTTASAGRVRILRSKAVVAILAEDSSPAYILAHIERWLDELQRTQPDTCNGLLADLLSRKGWGAG